MKVLKTRHKRATLIGGFFRLGFTSRTAFYNVCRSIGCALTCFEILNFYEGKNVSDSVVSKIEDVLEVLKNE